MNTANTTVKAHPGTAGEGPTGRRGFMLICASAAIAHGRPAHANADELAAAIRAFAGDAPVRAGKVKLEVAPLVENGNAVPVSVSVDSPMTAAEHVQAIAVFNERNPQREVAHFTLGPRAGRASVATRIRLSTSQQLVAVAKLSDGSCWSHTVDVIVTLAACIEG